MNNARTTENFSITFPLEMLKRAQQRADEENRTMSELLREAFREYERKTRWDEIVNYGRAKASMLGIKEENVPTIVKEWRKDQRKKVSRSLK